MLLLLGSDQRIWGRGHVGVHVCVPVHNWGGGARQVEIRGIRELRGRVQISWDTGYKSQRPRALVECVENNVLILRVGKLRPREGRYQSQREFSYRRRMVNDTL